MRSVARNLARLATGPDRGLVARDLAFRSQRLIRSELTVDVDGARLTLPTRDREVARILFVHRTYDRPLMAAALSALRHDDALRGRAFLDVGAHVGSATTTAARVFGASHGWAFEPDGANFALLERNLARNGLAGAFTATRAAVSDRPGEVDLERSSYNWGDHRVRRGRPKGARGEERRELVRVPAVSIDSLAAEGAIEAGAIGLAWIDVQGHEPEVLAGARALAAHGVPTVVELWPYGLGYGAGIERLARGIEAAWAGVVDLGPVVAGAQPLRLAPADVRDVAAALPPDGTTDLLLLPG